MERRGIGKSGGVLGDFVVLVLCVVVVIVIILIFTPPHKPGTDVACGVSLAALGQAIFLYNDDYDRYPAEDKWCDLLVKFTDVDKARFICRDALKAGDEGPCHYAMNPQCRPSSPDDVVLLFETKGGWNQYGGPELLTVDNHGGAGCVVLFNSGHTRYILTEQLGELKWGGESKNKPNH